MLWLAMACNIFGLSCLGAIFFLKLGIFFAIVIPCEERIAANRIGCWRSGRSGLLRTAVLRDCLQPQGRALAARLTSRLEVLPFHD